MPISHENMKKYPGGSIRSKEWLAIRKRILDRDNNKCAFCLAPNGEQILRDIPRHQGCYGLWNSELESFDIHSEIDGRHKAALPFWTFAHEEEESRLVKIVLTMMHLDHDPSNSDDSNLKAGCQKCHLNYDKGHHKANAARTRLAKMNNMEMFDQPLCDI